MLNDLTKGGQTFLQSFRMFTDIFWKLFTVFILVTIVLTATFFYLRTTSYERYKAFVYLEIAPTLYVEQIMSPALNKFGMDSNTLATSEKTTEFKYESGREVMLSNEQALQLVESGKFISKMLSILLLALIQASILGILISIFLAKLLSSFGKRLTEKKYLRGASVSDKRALSQMIKKKSKSGFSELEISGIKLPERIETYHFWINGVSGSGKTVAFSNLMSQIRGKDRRAVVYDLMGVYVERFYRPGKDIILNPFDQRSPCWSPWAECVHSVDYDMIAASQISISPGTTEDPFWKKAARSMYSATLRRLAKVGKARNMTLLRYLLTADLDKLRDLLQNTEAESLVAKDLEKTALSVKAILNDDIRAMRFLEDNGELFSIRDWVRQDDDDSWIFITSRPDQHETLMPLISTWYDIAITEALSLPDNPDRRIYFPLDELPTLKYLPALKRGMPLGRQKGLCFILGTQGFSQMNVNYGPEEAKSIIGNAGTKIILRSGEDAEKISQSFNQSETIERTESISYGVNDNRDGVSISNRTNMQYVILPSELQALDNLHAYFRIPGNYPTVKIDFKYVEYPSLNERFLPKDRDVDWLVDDEPTDRSSLGELGDKMDSLLLDKNRNKQPKGLDDSEIADERNEELQEIESELSLNTDSDEKGDSAYKF